MAVSIRRRCGGIQLYITYIQRMNPMRGYKISDAIGLAFTVSKFSLVFILLLLMTITIDDESTAPSPKHDISYASNFHAEQI